MRGSARKSRLIASPSGKRARKTPRLIKRGAGGPLNLQKAAGTTGRPRPGDSRPHNGPGARGFALCRPRSVKAARAKAQTNYGRSPERRRSPLPPPRRIDRAGGGFERGSRVPRFVGCRRRIGWRVREQGRGRGGGDFLKERGLLSVTG